ncbi:putative LRR receptor-like serine/threonine-protein kinase [Dichanthelium oligosanthes]|uniref:non-specific serine/threonine protein kinase n=1 Tax=Dichanthelium oligosanthes TaxID=888268 RepID=A0A1E5WFP6_9POAL|nr:putative LRR receptor-like serine/threonine-protein kinase [Dichanthelium oligosanthes]
MSPQATWILFSSHITLILLSTAWAATNQTTNTDRQALLCIKSQLSQSNRTGALATWSNGSPDFCQWQGVSCSRRHGPDPGRVAALDLEGEGLVGQIPPCISNLTYLARIHLPFNQLSGPVPPELGLLGSLSYVNLSSNALGGVIPAELASCSGLQVIVLKNNSFNGGIPAALLSSSLMQVFDLRGNNLSGPIPHLLPNSSNLNVLGLTGNRLSGTVPNSIYNLSLLTYLGLGNNGLVGKLPATMGNTLPSIQKIMMSRVMLFQNHRLEAGDWTFLSSLTNCTQLVMLNLRGNNLQGDLPSSVANLSRNLEYLILGSNKITGTIPSGKLYNLFVLNLSKNSGIIPAELNGCKRLMALNLSSNTLNEVGTLINLGSLNISNNNISGKIPSTLGSCVFLQGLRLCGNFLEGRIPTSLASLQEGIFANATSRLSLQGNPRALRNARHRNLVKVITACSTYDPLGNEFKALILEYMANGTLEDHLHTHRYGYLSLSARISIAVDIASILEYLHIWSIPPLVHCDLKPSNILFDDCNTARVGDFGLAQFLHGFYSSGGHPNSTSLIGARGSLGYIAPEYGMGSKISPEGDVYSYGIVLLEILTGKRPTDKMFKDHFNLHNYVKSALPHIDEIMDPALSQEIVGNHSHTEAQNHHNNSEARSCIFQLLNLALLCSEESPKDRPGIQDICSELVEVKEYFLS